MTGRAVAAMRVLLTGATGFVGPHVVDALRAGRVGDLEIIATAKEAASHPMFGDVAALDIADPAATREAVRSAAPTHIVNLAGIAASSAARSDPATAWRAHLDGVRNLAAAVMESARRCVLLNIGSGLIYGDAAKSGLPLSEDSPLAPVDQYGASKAAGDLLLGVLAREGLRTLRFRPFNHIGPGQTEAFVVPAFCAQIARIEAGLEPPVIKVGNLDAERDFLDVRDVARAYAVAAFKAGELESGTVFNIASGVPVRIREILDRLLAKSSARIEIEVDQTRLRPSDLPRVIGDASRARRALNWTPRWKLDDTLSDVLDDQRARLRAM